MMDVYAFLWKRKLYMREFWTTFIWEKLIYKGEQINNSKYHDYLLHEVLLLPALKNTSYLISEHFLS